MQQKYKNSYFSGELKNLWLNKDERTAETRESKREKDREVKREEIQKPEKQTNRAHFVCA